MLSPFGPYLEFSLSWREVSISNESWPGFSGDVPAKLRSTAACCRCPSHELARRISQPRTFPSGKRDESMMASKLAGEKAAASCRTPKLCTSEQAVRAAALQEANEIAALR
jgi:hypothetical protein